MAPSATSRLSWLTGDAVKNLVKTLQPIVIQCIDAVNSDFLGNYMPTAVIVGIDGFAVSGKFIPQPPLPGMKSFASDMFDSILRATLLHLV